MAAYVALFNRLDPYPYEQMADEFSEEEYTTYLEQQVREIVAAVSGDSSAVVTVTLESGPTFVYAEDKKLQNRSEESEKSEESESNYIIVRDENGSEKVFPSMMEASRQLNIDISNLCNLLKGRGESKRCGGYAWRYASCE